MRLGLVLLILPLAMLAAADKKPKTKQAPAAKKAVIMNQALPAGAKQIDANLWRYTAPDGKTWLYRKTPFGMTRFEESAMQPAAQAAAASEEIPAGMKAVEDGDSVRFERPGGPFGSTRWTKKKDQLDALEQKVWERDRPKTEGAERKAEPARNDGKE